MWRLQPQEGPRSCARSRFHKWLYILKLTVITALVHILSVTVLLVNMDRLENYILIWELGPNLRTTIDPYSPLKDAARKCKNGCGTPVNMQTFAGLQTFPFRLLSDTPKHSELTGADALVPSLIRFLPKLLLNSQYYIIFVETILVHNIHFTLCSQDDILMDTYY